MACRNESYIVLVVIAGQLLNANLGRKYGLPKPWRYLIATTLSLACCYGVLLTSLVMIWRIEGKIDAGRIFLRRGSSQSQKNKDKSKSDNNNVIHRANGQDKGNESDATSAQYNSAKEDSSTSNQSFQGDLTDYLAQSRESYDQFSAFLVTIISVIS